jgi:hypothetical protein
MVWEKRMNFRMRWMWSNTALKRQRILTADYTDFTDY